MIDNNLVNAAQILSAIATAISVIMVLGTWRVARNQLELLVNDRRLEATVEVHRDFARHWSDIRFIINDLPGIMDECSGKYDDIPSEVMNRVLPVLSFFERVGVLVDHHIVEKELFFDLIGQSTLDVWVASRNLVEHRRQNDPRRYENFELLFHLYNAYKVIVPPKQIGVSSDLVNQHVEEMRISLRKSILRRNSFNQN